MAKRGRTFPGVVELGRERWIGRWPTSWNLPSALPPLQRRMGRRQMGPDPPVSRLTLPSLAATLPADECTPQERHDPGYSGPVTVDEFVFLAMGLVLGLAAGVALIETFRTRPAARREVRVTVAQDAVPRRRSATLADDAFVGTPAEPARGGPADRREGPGGGAPGGIDRRTTVRSGPSGSPPPGAVPVLAVSSNGTVLGPSAGRSIVAPRPTASLVAVPVSGGDDPMMVALRASAAATGIASMRTSAPTAVALLDPPGEDLASLITETEGSVASGAPAVEAGPCADLRRVADERCAVASGARAQAVSAEDTLRQAQRAYDDHETRADAAARLADPRAVRAAKDSAQTTFRHDRAASQSTEEVEAAARAWLLEINRINAEARDAATAVGREREAARTLALELERLAVAADAARIAAETSDAACVAARQAAADCDEQTAADLAATQPPPYGGPDGPFRDEPAPVGSLASGGTPRIFRLLRGDRAAMGELVQALGGDDADERRRWQLALSDLVDAIVADSIAASVLGFPEGHPFWAPFSLTQDREIAGALSSLGYRFDGLGGWVDGRIPSQRDLSLAVGYAGLDPMRIRHWPNEQEMLDLFSEVTVAADEHLASVAPDLTLGELVSMLGRRADGLAEVWNQWGRLRPLLLEER